MDFQHENDQKNSQNHLFGQPDGFSLLTGKFAVRLIELPFTLQHDREIVMFRFYFPLFIKLCMVLLCVIGSLTVSGNGVIFLKVSAGGLVLTYSSARYSYKQLYKVYCYRKKRVILIRGQCQTLSSQIFSGAEAIDKNLPDFCLNVFQLSPSVSLLHMLLLCYLYPLFHVLSS